MKKASEIHNRTNYGQLKEPETLRFERLLPGPVDRVWTYLTDDKLRGRWLAPGPMELREGGKVELHFHHADLAPDDIPIPDKYKEFEDGTTLYGEVVKCDPPHSLIFTWGEATGEISEVTIELNTQGENVLLILTHRRLGTNRDVVIGAASGWHTHLDILADNLLGKTPAGFWYVHNRVEQEYEHLLK